MEKGNLRIVTAALVVAALSWGIAYGAEKKKEMRVAMGTLAVTVTDSAGKAIAKVPVQMIRDRKQIVKLETDKDGKCAFEKIPAGAFELVAGSLRPLKLVAAEDVKVNSLTLAIPRADYSAGALSGTEWAWVGVGVAGTAAVIVPVAVNASHNGGDHETVSP